MSGTLKGILQLFEFETLHELDNDSFKHPNKKLFHKIFCALMEKLEGLPEVEKCLELYGVSCCISGKVEAHYRKSVIDLVNKLNVRFPKVQVKPIAQSYLMVPQGTKIVTFLTEMSKMVFCAVNKSGDVYQTPTKEEEVESFFNLSNCLLTPEEIDCKLKELKESFKSKSKIRNDLCEEFESLANTPNVKEILGEFDSNVKVVEVLKNVIDGKKALFQSHYRKCEQLKLDVINVCAIVTKLEKHVPFSLDGHHILEAIGCKFFGTCSIDGQELIDNGKLNFASIIKVSVDRFHKVNNIFCVGKYKEYIKEIRALADMKDTECCNLNDKIVELRLIYDKYDPLVKASLNEMKSCLAKSQQPSHLKMLDYIDKKYSLSFDCSIEMIPSQVTELPVSPDKLVDWLSEDVSKHHSSSVKKGLGSTPKLGRKFGAKKIDIFNIKKLDLKNCLPVKFSLQSLIGLDKDRRATLASPMARKERFKIKHIDKKREPLKPTTSKALFPTSSSPIHECKDAFSCGNESMIDNASSLSCNRDLPMSSLQTDFNLTNLALGCGFNNHLNEKQLDLSAEVLKWEQNSSESSMDLSLDLPTNESEVSVKTCDSPTSELDSSNQN